ncbi:nuclease-related domain-containing protein [Clostridium sp.]|uniref:nuclease-related domain-containing protein n=1 Tax=Clostridium sp. TaxID=1506 RepID=UPI002611526A|nr:nuclease-related domain-containing protein [Clostridium sp.]
MNFDKLKIIILILLFFIIIILIKRKKKYKLNKGEEEVIEVLSEIKGYKLLNNIMIRRGAKTSQIDHILIGKKGVFVIETKDYSGIILGGDYDTNWTQILMGHNNNFYNPIRQNYGHVKALEEIININEIFIPLIVFTNKSNIKNLDTVNNVIQIKKLRKFIKKYKSNYKLSKKDIDGLYNKIKNKNINSNKEYKNHIKRVNKHIKDKN